MRASAMVAVTLAVVLGGCIGGLAPGDLLGGEKVSTASCQATPPEGGDDPADPASDVRGWENGIWYNESIAVDQSNGLSCHELVHVLSRAMARVERIRHLEFQQTPTAEIISRKAFRKQLEEGEPDEPAGRRTFANVKYEALFLVNESTNALAVQRRNRGTSVAGFYSPSENTLVLIADDVSTARVRSGLLAHELVHALQDQHFPEIPFPGIEDTARAHRGVTEGDANYVEHLYEERCQGPWLGTCLQPDDREERSGSGSGLANVGLFVLSYQPYSDGPPFVRHARDRGGWAAVNDLYRNPPASTEQTIHPRLYSEDEPQRIRVRASPGDGWSRVRMKNQSNYETWGETGLFTMFLDPSFESDGESSIISRESFLTHNQGNLDPYNYSDDASAGWDGDRLVAYRSEDGELAYTWRLTFDSTDDARQFSRAYRQVLRFRGAHRVEGQSIVWRIPEDRPFADAFALNRTGDTVRIVNAPTVDALGAFGGRAE